MSSICIITARGGSKRIPRKNIKDFLGKPIIAYSIESALDSELFDKVMVSTDDEEIAEISRKYGAEVPFFRSKANSNDLANTDDVIQEVVKELANRGDLFDEICCIYPTAPFISPRKLQDSYKLMKTTNASSVCPVVAFDFPPQRAFKVEHGSLKPVDAAAFNMRSQDLEPLFHDCGQFYWCKTDAFLKKGSLLLDDTIPFEISINEVQDIDTEEDWQLAELKYLFMKRSLASYNPDLENTVMLL